MSGHVVGHVGFSWDVDHVKVAVLYKLFITSLSMRGGSLAVGLLKSVKKCLWSVSSWNLEAPNRYICSLEVTNSADRASLSICEYLLSVSVSVRLT